MKKHLRQVIFIISVAVFVISCAGLILYTVMHQQA